MFELKLFSLLRTEVKGERAEANASLVEVFPTLPVTIMI